MRGFVFPPMPKLPKPKGPPAARPHKSNPHHKANKLKLRRGSLDPFDYASLASAPRQHAQAAPRPPFAGLSNMGATCWANVVLQALQYVAVSLLLLLLLLLLVLLLLPATAMLPLLLLTLLLLLLRLRAATAMLPLLPYY